MVFMSVCLVRESESEDVTDLKHRTSELEPNAHPSTLSRLNYRLPLPKFQKSGMGSDYVDSFCKSQSFHEKISGIVVFLPH
jgi:hypothetical protein